MYYFIVAACMVVGPLLSIGFETRATATALPLLALAAKWFVFWAVGIRLTLAGSRQILQPAYTAQTILGLAGPDVQVVVRELGFANLALGLIGLLSLATPAAWSIVAVSGGVFYGFAGLQHTRQRDRNRLETVAMISDLFAAVVLLGLGLALLAR